MLKPTSEVVILVDGQDRVVGTEEKHKAHMTPPQRHRAFSLFAFNEAGETLIQRRAFGKYHSAGLWANTCCGHPRPHEDIQEAVRRRTFEELGFMPSTLTPLAHVSYTLHLGQDLWELEYTHVIACDYAGDVEPNRDEVCDTLWISPTELLADVKANPQNYARWFRFYVLKYFDVIFGGVEPTRMATYG